LLLLTRSASALRKVGEGFLDVRCSDLRLSTQRFFVGDTGLPVFSSRSVVMWGGCINTQLHANRPGSGCHFTKDYFEYTPCVLYDWYINCVAGSNLCFRVRYHVFAGIYVCY
jgi:hypothetical protein